MLNFFTTSNGFRSTLPVVSNLTAMNVWDGVCMCFIYASLLEFVCVNYMGRKRPQHNVVYRPGENPVTQVMYKHICTLKSIKKVQLVSLFPYMYVIWIQLYVLVQHIHIKENKKIKRHKKWIYKCQNKIQSHFLF